MARHDYAAAFAAADAALDAGASGEDLLTLSWRRGSPPPGYRFDEARLEALPGPWPSFFLGLQRLDAALLGRAAAASPRRYGWMSVEAGWVLLQRGRLPAALAAFARARRWPGALHWKSYGLMGEALLCAGKEREAFALLERCRAEAPDYERPAAAAWKGQLLLWLGRYRRALAVLEPAAEAGATWGLGWLGAAQLKVGEPALGLKSVERCLELHPDDHEAVIWKAECLRALRRPREALAALDVDAFSRTGWRDSPWLRFNRALAHAEAGSPESAAAELAALRPSLLAQAARRTGRKDGVLLAAAALKAARGYRRYEAYGDAVWLKP